MANPSPTRPARMGIIVLLVLILAAAAGFGAWWKWLRKPVKPQVDMVAVIQLNNRGVGHMEQFKFPPAVEAFEEVVRVAPDWEPGNINLGIALMNLAKGKDLPQEEKNRVNERALKIFEDNLKRDPNNPYAVYAHFCIGLVIYFRGMPDEFPRAREHFEAVTKLDPRDAAAWYWAGATDLDDDERAYACFKRAAELDPYLTAAQSQLQVHLARHNKDAEAKAMREESEALRNAKWPSSIDTRYYSDLGRYGLVIDFAPERIATRPPAAPLPVFLRNDQFQVQLAPGVRWAKTDDFGPGPTGELRAAVRKRFGAVVVVLDFNHDGKPDLFLLGAVVENGKVRDLLLRNDGDGHFTDVTREAGLAEPRPSLGCVVGDFDNDGYPDLFITGAGEQHLFRNDGKGGFVDVTKRAGLDKLTSVCLGAAFVDIDQDSDLDLIVAEYAATPEQALDLLRGKAGASGKGLAVYINTGEAPPEEAREDPPPLKPGFRRDDKLSLAAAEASAPVVGMAVADLDLDFDLDWFVLADGRRPGLALNDRLLRFHRAALAEALAPAGRWNGALVFDVNRDQRSDLFLVGPGRAPILLLHRPTSEGSDPTQWFEAVPTNSPPLRQAQAVDVDLDGVTDVVGLSEDGKPVLLQYDGKRLVHIAEAFGREIDWPADVVAVSVADLDCDGWPDLLIWSESQGLQLYRNQGNGNHGVKLALAGHRRFNINLNRCNADGFGTRVTVQAGDLLTSAEYTTLSAGLGQSHQPLLFGLGRYAEPDVVRLRWPDLSIQAEFNSIPAAACGVIRIDQENRKETSCPVLFTWNGRRFEFITDFLGAGSVGEPLPEGGHRRPRPEESIKIEAEQLALRDGRYVLKIAEPMDEITLLDRLQLLVLDHPVDVRVYPDERFATADPPASQDLIAFRQEIYPVKAVDHRGRDVKGKLRAWDRDTVNGFAKCSWIGFAENHGVELDFGDRLAKLGPTDRLVLCLAGWTDYAYPESIWAAHQAGVEMEFPVLERLGEDGQWHKVADLGFPAGLPRMMTFDVTGKLGGARCVLRLRTNLHVYWDQIFVAPVIERIPRAEADKGRPNGETIRVTPLEVGSARLEARGCVQEFSPDGRQPTIYDYERIAAIPVNKLKGRLTRFGDVTELLHAVDDRFVIFGAGDELTIQFDAAKLPALPPGWKRSFVLRTWGYCKDSSPFTAHGDTVEPLPFRAMSNYPYGPQEHYPTDAGHEEYRRKYNTRAVGAPRR